YPFRFLPIRDEYVWGAEEFLLADLGYRDSLLRSGWLGASNLSEVMDIYMDRVVGDEVFSRYGRQFPLQIKMLEVKGKMPLRVHPDDEISAQRYDSLGKEKFWYIIKAEKNARLYLGFREDTDASKLLSACEEGSVEELMNTVAPYAGQCVRIAPGVVHGASGGLLIAEVSQCSGLDFCVWNWGQALGEEEFDSSVGLSDALDFIDYKRFAGDAPGQPGNSGSAGDGFARTLLELPQFKISLLYLAAPLQITAGEPASFTAYFCVDGRADVEAENADDGEAVQQLRSRDAVLVPAECPKFKLIPREPTLLLEITVPPYTEPDSYVGDANLSEPEEEQ
ncbi:MAG: class I mannose-6-phosphate isomerase, partial [Bacteroidales bacterium]|nr:class I mannose-6-phosphate isomerase [Bacteroidales bacterium]